VHCSWHEVILIPAKPVIFSSGWEMVSLSNKIFSDMGTDDGSACSVFIKSSPVHSPSAASTLQSSFELE
jgi:hypothetical protein